MGRHAINEITGTLIKPDRTGSGFFFKQVYVQVPFFLLVFSATLADPLIIDMMEYRTCYLVLPYNKSDCATIGSGYNDTKTTRIQEEVQPFVTVLKLCKDLPEAIISSVICFFLGPWSNSHGRRPVMLLALGGYTVGSFVTTAISAIPSATPWFLLLPALPVCLCGGFPAFLTVTVCYLTDTSTAENRGASMGFFEAIITCAVLFASICGAFAFNGHDNITVFLLTSFCILAAWLFVFATLPESVEDPIENRHIKGVFDCSLIPETVKTVVKKRQDKDRNLLWIIIILTTILSVTINDDVTFLYLQRKLHWSLQKYTLFNGGRFVVWIFGSLLGGYVLNQKFHVEETFLIMLGFSSTMASAYFQGLATEDWHMYVSAVSRCFGGAIGPMAKTLISKIVLPEELGTVFSFLIVFETLASLVGSPFYTYLYNTTLHTFPGAYNFVTAAIYGLEMILTIPAIVIQVNKHKQEIHG